MPDPERIARRGKRPGDTVSPLSIWMPGYFFLVGREVVLDLAPEAADARQDDIAEVLEFWRRIGATDYTRRLRELASVTHDSGRLRLLPFTEMDRLMRVIRKLQRA